LRAWADDHMYNFFLSPAKNKQYVLLAVDIIIVASAIGLSYLFRFLIHQESISIDNIIVRLDIRHALLVVIYIFSLYIFSQYNLNQIVAVGNFPKMLFMGLTAGAVVTASVFYFFPKYIFGRTSLVSHYLILLVMLGLWRIIFVKYILKSGSVKRILVVGDQQQVDRFLGDIEQHVGSGYEVAGAYYRDVDGFRQSCCTDADCETKVSKVLARNDFDYFVYDTKCRNFNSADIESILQLKYKGKAIYDIPTFYQDMIGKAPIEFIDSVWLLFNTQLQRGQRQYYERAKRLLDIGLSLLLLMILAVPMVLIGLLIKMTSKGPVLFIQERLCVQEGVFNCIKFRTMIDAHKPEQVQPAWATWESDRITCLGHFLRKTRLDETPQLWNILRGDMSFVGPRPIRKYFAEEMARKIPFYNLRFMVKPGLSGWAQVNIGYADTAESQVEKFRYELFYLQNMSFLLDLIIIVKTIQMIIKGEGR
jgi:exopolysaccharide biosynthesis polyprenyl glycosylphosphotransferase